MAFNLGNVSYEEQVRLELEELKVHEGFVNDDNSTEASVNVIEQINRTYQYCMENANNSNSLETGDVGSAFIHAPLDTGTSNRVYHFDSLLAATMFDYAQAGLALKPIQSLLRYPAKRPFLTIFFKYGKCIKRSSSIGVRSTPEYLCRN